MALADIHNVCFVRMAAVPSYIKKRPKVTEIVRSSPLGLDAQCRDFMQ